MPPRFNKLLVLDLDETLVFAAKQPLARPADFVGPFHVYKRPHVEAFLEQCLQWFDVGIWTSAMRPYATWVVRSLLRAPQRLAFFWTYERCTPRHDAEARCSHEIKQLKKLKHRRFNGTAYPLSRMLVVDDTPETYADNYGNAIRVSAFKGEPTDDELPLLLRYLEAIGDADNVRTIEKRNWRSRAGTIQ